MDVDSLPESGQYLVEVMFFFVSNRLFSQHVASVVTQEQQGPPPALSLKRPADACDPDPAYNALKLQQGDDVSTFFNAMRERGITSAMIEFMASISSEYVLFCLVQNLTDAVSADPASSVVPSQSQNASSASSQNPSNTLSAFVPGLDATSLSMPPPLNQAGK